MRVLSVNVGGARPSVWKDVGSTGIDKRPAPGPVAVTAPGAGQAGLAGDNICDKRNHGGPDQAVYAYAREDLDRWEELLGPLRNGFFGENLTTTGVPVTDALIGERWRVGRSVILEVSCPRISCVTFQGWVGRAGWMAEFIRAGRPGGYLRVIEPGEIRAGDPIEIVHRPGHDVTVGLAFRALAGEPELLPRLLPADALPAETREQVRRRVNRGT